MDLYNHGGSKSWRLQQFMNLLKNPNYIDGATDYCLLIPFADEYNCNLNQRIYLSILYALSYSNTSSMRVFLDYPNLYDIDGSFEEWWSTNKNSLYFNQDKRRTKYTNEFKQSLFQLKRHLGKNPYKTIIKYIGKDYSFESFYNYIYKNWYGFGGFTTMLFFDAIYGLTDLYHDGQKLHWNELGNTVKKGMANLLYRDEDIKTGKYNFKLYDKSFEKIHSLSKIPIIQLESTLCAYHKFFKKTRYNGYYADRLLEECINHQKYLPVNLLEYRKKVIPKDYLSELHGGRGINHDRFNEWYEI